MTSSYKCPIKPSLELWIKRINGKVLRNVKTRGKCCMFVLVVDDSYTGYYLRVYFVRLLPEILATFALSRVAFICVVKHANKPNWTNCKLNQSKKGETK